MSDTYILKGSTGTYQNKAGETKKKWVTVGTLYNRDGRWSVKIDALPASGWDGWLSAFEPQQEGEFNSRQSSQPTRRGKPSGDFSDMQNDVPF